MFSKEFLDQIVDFRIEEYLALKGIMPAGKPQRISGDLSYWYNSPLHKESTPSFKVNTRLNLWKDFGLSGTNTVYEGGNIINLVMKMESVGFREAVEKIAYLKDLAIEKDIQIVFPNKTYEEVKKEQKAFLIQKEDKLTNPALLKYIESRGIDIKIAQKYCKELHYQYQEVNKPKNYFGIAMKNHSDAYEVSNAYVKISVGAKDFSTINVNDQKNWIVFEGKYDFLAYMTDKKYQDPPANILILNSVALTDKAIDFLQKENANKVLVCADFDRAGEESTQKFKEAFKENCHDMRKIYEGFKDYNDKILNKPLPYIQNQKIPEHTEVIEQPSQHRVQEKQQDKQEIKTEKTELVENEKIEPFSKKKPWEMSKEEYQTAVEKITKEIQDIALKQKQGTISVVEGLKQRRTLQQDLVELKKPFSSQELSYEQIVFVAEKKGLIEGKVKTMEEIATVKEAPDDLFFIVEKKNCKQTMRLEVHAVFLDEYDLIKYNNPKLQAGNYISKEALEKIAEHQPVKVKMQDKTEMEFSRFLELKKEKKEEVYQMKVFSI